MEEFKGALKREQAIETVLLGNDEATVKVKRLRNLGVEEETAEEMVNNYQIGQMAPVYYERLEFDDDATNTDIDTDK